MKFSFSPSSTDLKKVEEGTQLLLGDIKSEKELEIQVEFQENAFLIFLTVFNNRKSRNNRTPYRKFRQGVLFFRRQNNKYGRRRYEQKK